MAEWLNISFGSDSEDEFLMKRKTEYDINRETEDEIGENAVFEFEHASYLTEFDDDYDPNEDPDFEGPEGIDDLKYDILKMLFSNEDDIDEEFEVDEDIFEDTRVCFKGKELTLGSCDHMCCEVWRLEAIYPSKPDIALFGRDMTKVYEIYAERRSPINSFLKHHGESSGNQCTDQECKNPNAMKILVKARASKIFNSQTAAKLKSIANASKISFQNSSA